MPPRRTISIVRKKLGREKADGMTMGDGNKALRTERWRYIRYKDGTEELYDEQKDPWEWTNLAGKSDYTGEISKLKALLR